jgi:hypothetical protein
MLSYSEMESNNMSCTAGKGKRGCWRGRTAGRRKRACWRGR